VNKTGLKDICIERTEGKSYISHNKFIVKLEEGNPVAVWTGGMNFSEGGIFGHSNVAHVMEGEEVAKKFMAYWEILSGNPKMAAERTDVEKLSPVPVMPVSKGSTCIFSPRKNLNALNFYHDLALSAKSGLFMTFAFGMNDRFKDVYPESHGQLRFALMESIAGSIAKGPKRDAEIEAVQKLRNLRENVFAVGKIIGTNAIDGWLKERLTGLNSAVKYIHNKFMLVDPLSDDPVVITGSANFSEASITKNDENMVIVAGNKRAADFYLGEYMRLFSHFSFRESLKWRKEDEPPKPLRTDDWWKDYYGNTSRSFRRSFFAMVDQG
jgi:hypothetical protein